MDIPLTNGGVAIIDNIDFGKVSQYQWYRAHYRGQHYAIADKDGKPTKMHRLIGINLFDNPRRIDHKNRNGLDNRRSNLRPCTASQNAANTSLRKDRQGSYKGASWERGPKKWRAYIRVNRKRLFLGYFATEIAAAHEYDKAAIKYFGEFACLNFSSQGQSKFEVAPNP